MMPKGIVAMLGVALLTGCAGGPHQTLDLDAVEEAIQQTQSGTRAFTMTRTQNGLAIQISGRVDDDYRYSASVTVDGRPMLEEIVLDDARYLKVLDPSLLVQAPAGVAVNALRAGSWVVDPLGAPRDAVADSDQDLPGPLLSPLTVWDQVRFLETVPGALRKAQRHHEYNPDASNYLKKFDKFPRHEADGIRFDALPAAFDPDLAFKDGLPVDLGHLTPYFLYTSVWVRDGSVTRAELLFDIPDISADVERVQRLQAERSGAPYRSTDRPLIPRPYAVTYQLGSVTGPPSLTAPAGAIPANLRQLITALTPKSKS